MQPKQVSPCMGLLLATKAGSTFGNKVGLLGAYIRSDLGYINEYGFGPHGVQSWLGLIKVLGSFSYKDQQ
jgi:hypothetical protein